tara:strand:- start:523 stop:822 length:300 start_codon:yes stop_codon:yes gene_type:complete
MNFEWEATYGCGSHPGTVFVCGDWYCVQGSKNINKAPRGYFNNFVGFNYIYKDFDCLEDVFKNSVEFGVIDVEIIQDVDTMTSTKPVETLDQLVAMVGE